MERISVSLITTLYNEADNVLGFLESYKCQTKYADEFIIVDGGSTDGTIETIRTFAKNNAHLSIRLIVDPSCSKKHIAGPIAKGRNVAIEHAKHDIIAVTDAGCVLESCWLEEITRPFDDPQTDVVAGWYKPYETNSFQRYYARVYMASEEEAKRDTFLPSSRSIAFKKACWEKVGGYPTETLTAEDTYFDLRLKEAKCRFVFAPKAVVLWHCPASEEEALQKAHYYAQGDGKMRLFFGKFLVRNLLLCLPVHIMLSNKKRKRFWFNYRMMMQYQKGYIKGLFS